MMIPTEVITLNIHAAASNAVFLLALLEGAISLVASVVTAEGQNFYFTRHKQLFFLRYEPNQNRTIWFWFDSSYIIDWEEKIERIVEEEELKVETSITEIHGWWWLSAMVDDRRQLASMWESVNKLKGKKMKNELAESPKWVKISSLHNEKQDIKDNMIFFVLIVNWILNFFVRTAIH